MTKTKKTAVAGVILAVSGGIAVIPFTLIGRKLALAAGVAATTGLNLYTAFGLIGAVLALLGGVFVLKKPRAAGILLLIAAALAGITVIGGYILNIVAFLLFLIAAIFAFGQEKVSLKS